MSRRPVLAALALLAACGADAPAPDLSFESAGPHPVGVVAREAAIGRSLRYLVWFPTEAARAAEAAAGVPIEALAPAVERAGYAALLATASADCPTRTAHAALDAPVAAGTWPLVVVSHCHECTAFSSATIAERLASHGFVVAAVEHDGNTLWDQQDGTGAPLDTATLALRVGDVRVVLDELLAGALPGGTLDPARVGVFGHSFGAVTAGMVAMDDVRVRAAFALAAPMENPLLPGVRIASLAKPLGFLLAGEDNSIGELGNLLLRKNFDEAPGPAWKLEVADAGHWSVSDLVGVIPGFAPGCGPGTRQTDGQPFRYLGAAAGRAIAAAHVTAFFAATLDDDTGARAYLEAGRPSGTVTAAAR